MKRLILLLLTGLRVSAAEPEYPVASIPAGLLKNANAVVRVQEQHIKMNSLKDVRILTRYVVTVLNEAGSKHAAFYDYYSQLREIKSIKGALYDASGKQIRKLKQNEIKDESFVSDFSLMEDDRLKSHHFYHRVYPYTVEYEEEARISQTFFIPRWAPQDDEFLSYRKAA